MAAPNGKIRYAVVGLGYIAQVAVLPSFAHATRNSELVALVSDDPKKLKQLGRKYKVANTYSYNNFESCLRSGMVDAVYIALPNSMHRDYAIHAAQAGCHVLCEKPLAVTELECQQIIESAREHRVKLMTAYRLHFEEANLKAIEIARSGKLGDLRFFHSEFSQQVKAGDIRLQRALGGGSLYDLGVYCINAARNLFHDEPTEVVAFTANSGDPRFSEVDEMTSAILKFPGERLATFITSFGATDVTNYQIVGTTGDLRVANGYEYASKITHELRIEGKKEKQVFPKRDQFAPELLYFSDCILNNNEPEPSGKEGLADVRVVRALYESAQRGHPIALEEFEKESRPGIEMEIHREPVDEPELIHAEPPSGEK